MKLTRTKLWIGIAALLLVVLAGVGIALYKGRDRTLPPDEAHRRGTKLLAEGKLHEAYAHFHHAAKTRPTEASYHWDAAQTAQKLGDAKVAADHAKEAWILGLKNKDVFLLRASDASGDPRTRLQKGLEWLRELPDSPERKELEGDLQQSVGDNAEGLRIWSALFTESPTAGLANKMALAQVVLGRPETGHQFLRSCRAKGLLDEEGYGLLGSLSAYAGDSNESAAVFAEGRAKFPTGDNLKITEAVFLIWRDRLPEAAALLDPMRETSPDPARVALRNQARIFLGFIRAYRPELGGLDDLAKAAAGEGPALEGERLFYRGLKEKSAETLKKARQLLKAHPACDWALARECVRSGAWKDAVESYRRVQGLLARAPALQVELASALHRAGSTEEALDTLRRLHDRNMYSRSSLEMFRDLAFQRGLNKEAAEAQERLSKKYGDDPAVAVAGGFLALHTGQLNEAASILDSLSAQHPGREDVELAQLSVLFARKDYEGVLKAATSVRASAEAVAPIQAAALVMLGRDDEATTLYERVLATKRDPLTLISFANLLLRQEKIDRAGALYLEAAQLQPKNAVAQMGLAFVELRRKNWTAARGHAEAASAGSIPQAHTLIAEIELQEGRPDRALAACTRALGLAPQDERANFLMGVALLDSGRADEAEPILRRAAAAKPESSHYRSQLARAFMSRGAFGDALDQVDGALARKPSDDLSLLSLRMVLLSRLGKTAEAREQLVSLKSRLAPERYTLCDAWLLFQEGKTSEAAERLRSELKDPNAAYFWAELVLATGRADNVIEALDRHTYDGARWGRLGEAAYQKGLMAVAGECFRRAVRHEPENAQHLNNFAYSSLLAGTFNEAEVEAAAKKVHTMLPGNPSVIHTYASVLLKCRKERECIELLDKSPTLTQKTARLLLAKAQAHERIEQWDPALKAYTACIALPETEGAAGDLARPALQQKIDQVRARVEKR